MSKPNSHIAKKQGTVIALHDSHPEQALEGLNRITGLNFARWPESLAVRAPLEQDADIDYLPERATGNCTPR